MIVLDFRGFDSSRILISSEGILMSIGNFLEMLSQRILAGIISVGRLGVVGTPASRNSTGGKAVDCARCLCGNLGCECRLSGGAACLTPLV